MYEGDWQENYEKWFKDKYNSDFNFAEKYDAQKKNDGDYYEYEDSTESMIWELQDHDERCGWRSTLHDILMEEITFDCPEAELVV